MAESIAKGGGFAQGLSLPAAANWPVKGECFAHGLFPAGGSAMARERGVLRTSLSYPKAGPSAVKGLAILAFLSFPVPVAARFFAKHLAIGGALAFRWCAHGARTAKLLRTWLARWPKTGHWLCLWLSAQPFCRARPVRAPLAGECLRTCQALRKDARGQGRGGRKESASHKAFPFPAAANWPVKGECFAQGLSHSGGIPCGRPSHWKAACPLHRKAANLAADFFLLFCQMTCHKGTKICYNLDN